MTTFQCRLLATLAAGALALPAMAGYGNEVKRTAEMPSYAVITPTDAIHAGGGTAQDTALALDVAAALAEDQRLEGATITVAANDGAVMLSGSAESPEQSELAQQTAKKVAGVANVSGTLSAQGG